MSMQRPAGNELPSTPEGNDQYRYGGYYISIRDQIRRAGKFTDKAYLPSYGLMDVTNINTTDGGLRIILDQNNRREPEESDLIFFTQDTLEDIGVDYKRLKTRTPKDEIDPEVTGVYRKISAEVAERIGKEPFLPKK